MKVIEEPQLVEKRKFPWYVELFLYPLNGAGLVHLGIFVIVPIFN